MSELPLAVQREKISLPLRDILPETLQRARDLLATKTEDRWTREEIYARELVLLHEMKPEEPAVEAEIQSMRVGPMGLVAVPAEYFCQYGLDIKGTSPFEHTCVVELANGCVGYVPTLRAFVGGGYEPETARSSKLCPEAGHQISMTATRLLHSLQD